ncbi:MAG: PQQ-binding-like beta-propeller repeat protein [Thermoguttaceae bacterium]|jgi:outer membrane protein assembly factor BamB
MGTLRKLAIPTSAAIFSLIVQTTLGDNWPQWLGPKQDGISRETGLLTEWPEKGPAELWRVSLGNGFSAVSVVGDRAFTLFGSNEGEFAVAVNVADGKTVWKTRLSDLLKNDTYGDGPRATPAVDSGRVYVLSGKGALRCLDAADGNPVWGCDLLKKFGGEPPEFGFAASPVVMGDMLVVVTGARKGKSLVAFNKANGNVVWTALDDKIGCSTPREVAVNGVRQIIVLMGEAVVSVSPKDGTEYWRQAWKTELNANVATPVISGDRLFISTGYSTGCALFELSVNDGKPAAKKVWANKEMKNYISTSVLVDGYLYGFNNNKLTCLDFRTGKAAKWSIGGFNRGSLIAADGKLIIYGDEGILALAEISPKSYKELAKLKFCDERTWTVPTLSGGRLFLRNEKELACLQVGK